MFFGEVLASTKRRRNNLPCNLVLYWDEYLDTGPCSKAVFHVKQLHALRGKRPSRHSVLSVSGLRSPDPGPPPSLPLLRRCVQNEVASDHTQDRKSTRLNSSH